MYKVNLITRKHLGHPLSREATDGRAPQGVLRGRFFSFEAIGGSILSCQLLKRGLFGAV